MRVRKHTNSTQAYSISNLSTSADALDWSRRILGFLGIWPEESSYLRFSFFFGYVVIHVACEYAYLFQNIRKLERIISSMEEIIPFTAVIMKTILMQKNKIILCKIIRYMNKNSVVKIERGDEEVKIFNRYNAMAKNFVRIVVPMIFLSSSIYFVKPFFAETTGSKGNGTVVFNLPYHVRLFYDITDPRIYTLIYTLQAPLVLIVTFGCLGPDCLMVTLATHVCAELSFLAIRIKNLKCDTIGYHEDLRILINKHVELIQMAKILEDAFNLFLLGQLFGATFLICFLGYNVLANTTDGQETDLLNFSLYGFLVVVLLYVYCYIGNCLTDESLKVHDAFFHCSWYELPVKNSKPLITCIIRSQKPLYLTAGKFYVFSLERFADVMRTCMAYVSVLRTLLQTDLTTPITRAT